MTIVGGLNQAVTLRAAAGGASLARLDPNAPAERWSGGGKKPAKPEVGGVAPVAALRKLLSYTGRGCEGVLVSDLGSIVGKECKSLAWTGGVKETRCLVEIARNQHSFRDRPYLRVSLTVQSEKTCPKQCTLLTSASQHGSASFRVVRNWQLTPPAPSATGPCLTRECRLEMRALEKYLCLHFTGGSGASHKFARVELSQEAAATTDQSANPQRQGSRAGVAPDSALAGGIPARDQARARNACERAAKSAAAPGIDQEEGLPGGDGPRAPGGVQSLHPQRQSSHAGVAPRSGLAGHQAGKPAAPDCVYRDEESPSGAGLLQASGGVRILRAPARAGVVASEVGSDTTGTESFSWNGQLEAADKTPPIAGPPSDDAATGEGLSAKGPAEASGHRGRRQREASEKEARRLRRGFEAAETPETGRLEETGRGAPPHDDQTEAGAARDARDLEPQTPPRKKPGRLDTGRHPARSYHGKPCDSRPQGAEARGACGLEADAPPRKNPGRLETGHPASSAYHGEPCDSRPQGAEAEGSPRKNPGRKETGHPASSGSHYGAPRDSRPQGAEAKGACGWEPEAPRRLETGHSASAGYHYAAPCDRPQGGFEAGAAPRKKSGRLETGRPAGPAPGHRAPRDSRTAAQPPRGGSEAGDSPPNGRAEAVGVCLSSGDSVGSEGERGGNLDSQLRMEALRTRDETRDPPVNGGGFSDSEGERGGRDRTELSHPYSRASSAEEGDASVWVEVNVSGLAAHAPSGGCSNRSRTAVISVSGDLSSAGSSTSLHESHLQTTPEDSVATRGAAARASPARSRKPAAPRHDETAKWSLPSVSAVFGDESTLQPADDPQTSCFEQLEAALALARRDGAACSEEPPFDRTVPAAPRAQRPAAATPTRGNPCSDVVPGLAKGKGSPRGSWTGRSPGAPRAGTSPGNQHSRDSTGATRRSRDEESAQRNGPSAETQRPYSTAPRRSSRDEGSAQGNGLSAETQRHYSRRSRNEESAETQRRYSTAAPRRSRDEKSTQESREVASEGRPGRSPETRRRQTSRDNQYSAPVVSRSRDDRSALADQPVFSAEMQQAPAARGSRRSRHGYGQPGYEQESLPDGGEPVFCAGAQATEVSSRRTSLGGDEASDFFIELRHPALLRDVCGLMDERNSVFLRREMAVEDETVSSLRNVDGDCSTALEEGSQPRQVSPGLEARTPKPRETEHHPSAYQASPLGREYRPLRPDAHPPASSPGGLAAAAGQRTPKTRELDTQPAYLASPLDAPAPEAPEAAVFGLPACPEERPSGKERGRRPKPETPPRRSDRGGGEQQPGGTCSPESRGAPVACEARGGDNASHTHREVAHCEVAHYKVGHYEDALRRAPAGSGADPTAFSAGDPTEHGEHPASPASPHRTPCQASPSARGSCPPSSKRRAPLREAPATPAGGTPPTPHRRAGAESEPRSRERSASKAAPAAPPNSVATASCEAAQAAASPAAGTPETLPPAASVRGAGRSWSPEERTPPQFHSAESSGVLTVVSNPDARHHTRHAAAPPTTNQGPANEVLSPTSTTFDVSPASLTNANHHPQLLLSLQHSKPLFAPASCVQLIPVGRPPGALGKHPAADPECGLEGAAYARLRSLRDLREKRADAQRREVASLASEQEAQGGANRPGLGGKDTRFARCGGAAKGAHAAHERWMAEPADGNDAGPRLLLEHTETERWRGDAHGFVQSGVCFEGLRQRASKEEQTSQPEAPRVNANGYAGTEGVGTAKRRAEAGAPAATGHQNTRQRGACDRDAEGGFAAEAKQDGSGAYEALAQPSVLCDFTSHAAAMDTTGGLAQKLTSSRADKSAPSHCGSSPRDARDPAWRAGAAPSDNELTCTAKALFRSPSTRDSSRCSSPFPSAGGNPLGGKSPQPGSSGSSPPANPPPRPCRPPPRAPVPAGAGGHGREKSRGNPAQPPGTLPEGSGGLPSWQVAGWQPSGASGHGFAGGAKAAGGGWDLSGWMPGEAAGAGRGKAGGANASPLTLLSCVPDMRPADRLISTAMRTLISSNIAETVEDAAPAPVLQRQPQRRAATLSPADAALSVADLSACRSPPRPIARLI
eukprot:gene14137-21659_t